MTLTKILITNKKLNNEIFKNNNNNNNTNNNRNSKQPKHPSPSR